jgi:hypothetical protein
MKRYIYLISFGLILTLNSCSDKILDEIDTNPNVTQNAPLNTLLPAAQMTVFQRVVGSISIISGYASEHTNFTGLVTDSKSQLASASNFAVSGGTNWSSAYQAIRYFADIRSRADLAKRNGYSAIADIMSAYTLSLLVDAYGDIPYKEIIQPGNIQPKFDKAEDIYIEIQKLLDSGILKCDQATTADSRPGNDDMVFRGNMALWKKTAWALKARLINRLSNVGAKDIEILSAINNSFASTENFMVTGYLSNPENANPISNSFMNASTIVIASGIVNTMRAFLDTNEDILGDPRANLWFTKIRNTIVTPPTSRANTDITLNGTLYSKPLYMQNRTAPLPLLTFTELKFIEAEVQLRLGDKAKAYAAYEAALRSSLSQSSIFNSSVALNATQVNAYMARPKVMMGADKLTMKDIIAQKYIFLFLFQSQEAYNDIRRTSLISLNDPDGTAKRFAYPIEEITRNANAPQASDRETIYQNNARLFWAKL